LCAPCHGATLLHSGPPRKMWFVNRSRTYDCLRLLSIPIRRCTLSTVGRWGRARATTRRIKERRATSRFLPLSPRPGNISAVSCATEIGPRERRLRAISRPFLPPCPVACAEFSHGLMLGSIVGMLSKRNHRGAQDPAFARRARKGPLEALAE